MTILNSNEYRAYKAYQATGLTPLEIERMRERLDAYERGHLPDNPDRASLPFQDTEVWTDEQWRQDRRAEFARDATLDDYTGPYLDDNDLEDDT